MKKYIVTSISLLLGFFAISFAKQTPQEMNRVEIRAELSHPVMLENSRDKNYLKISLEGFELKNYKRVPINLALVIDRSSSMDGDRIARAKEAAILAINMLNEEDVFSLTVYDSDARIIIPATKVKNKEKLIAIVEREVVAQGMTALFAGVSLGIKEIDRYLDPEKVNRIILLSDGQANVGPTSLDELSDLAKVAAKKGVAITTIGLGNGYNERLMSTIAGFSDGNHVYAKNASDLESAFVHEFEDVMSVIAQDVEVIIKLKGKTKAVRLLGRDGEVKGNNVSVNLNQLYANQEKYVLLEIEPESGKSDEVKEIADVVVSYNNMLTSKKDKYRQAVNLQYSGLKERVDEAVVSDVVVETAIQKSILDQEEALKLREEGQFDKAAAVIERMESPFKELLEDDKNTPEQRAKLKKRYDDVYSSSSFDYRSIQPMSPSTKKEMEEQIYQEKRQIKKKN